MNQSAILLFASVRSIRYFRLPALSPVRYHSTTDARNLDERGNPYAREFDVNALFDIRHMENLSTNYGVSYLQRGRFGLSHDIQVSGAIRSHHGRDQPAECS